jgi:hypothetical protein
MIGHTHRVGHSNSVECAAVGTDPQTCTRRGGSAGTRPWTVRPPPDPAAGRARSCIARQTSTGPSARRHRSASTTTSMRPVPPSWSAVVKVERGRGRGQEPVARFGCCRCSHALPLSFLHPSVSQDARCCHSFTAPTNELDVIPSRHELPASALKMTSDDILRTRSIGTVPRYLNNKGTQSLLSTNETAPECGELERNGWATRCCPFYEG